MLRSARSWRRRHACRVSRMRLASSLHHVLPKQQFGRKDRNQPAAAIAAIDRRDLRFAAGAGRQHGRAPDRCGVIGGEDRAHADRRPAPPARRRHRRRRPCPVRRPAQRPSPAAPRSDSSGSSVSRKAVTPRTSASDRGSAGEIGRAASAISSTASRGKANSWPPTSKLTECRLAQVHAFGGKRRAARPIAWRDCRLPRVAGAERMSREQHGKVEDLDEVRIRARAERAFEFLAGPGHQCRLRGFRSGASPFDQLFDLVHGQRHGGLAAHHNDALRSCSALLPRCQQARQCSATGTTAPRRLASPIRPGGACGMRATAGSSDRLPPRPWPRSA